MQAVDRREGEPFSLPPFPIAPWAVKRSVDQILLGEGVYSKQVLWREVCLSERESPLLYHYITLGTLIQDGLKPPLNEWFYSASWFARASFTYLHALKTHTEYRSERIPYVTPDAVRHVLSTDVGSDSVIPGSVVDFIMDELNGDLNNFDRNRFQAGVKNSYQGVTSPSPEEYTAELQRRGENFLGREKGFGYEWDRIIGNFPNVDILNKITIALTDMDRLLHASLEAPGRFRARINETEIPLKESRYVCPTRRNKGITIAIRGGRNMWEIGN